MDLSKERLTEEFGPTNLIYLNIISQSLCKNFLDASLSLVSNFMLTAKFAFKEARLHIIKRQTKTMIVNNFISHRSKVYNNKIKNQNAMTEIHRDKILEKDHIIYYVIKRQK